MTPYLIGIAGGSCSGKSEITRSLTTLLGDAVHIELDAYYRPIAVDGERDVMSHNFDDPAAIDHDLLLVHMTRIAGGDAIHIPIYDMTSHSRRTDTRRLEPQRFVIVEGLHALYWPDLRRLFHKTVFVDAPEGVCLERRIARDVATRGRDPDEVRHRYDHHVVPMYRRYVMPVRVFADVPVNGLYPVARSAERILEFIKEDPRSGI